MHYTPDEAEAFVAALRHARKRKRGRPMTPLGVDADRTKAMIAMIEAGATLVDVSCYYGVSKQRVSRILQHAGYDRRNGWGATKHAARRARGDARREAARLRAEQRAALYVARTARNAAIVESYIATQSTMDTARAFGLSQMAVYRVCRNVGVVRPRAAAVPKIIIAKRVDGRRKRKMGITTPAVDDPGKP